MIYQEYYTDPEAFALLLRKGEKEAREYVINSRLQKIKSDNSLKEYSNELKNPNFEEQLKKIVASKESLDDVVIELSTRFEGLNKGISKEAAENISNAEVYLNQYMEDKLSQYDYILQLSLDDYCSLNKCKDKITDVEKEKMRLYIAAMKTFARIIKNNAEVKLTDQNNRRLIENKVIERINDYTQKDEGKRERKLELITNIVRDVYFDITKTAFENLTSYIRDKDQDLTTTKKEEDEIINGVEL